MATINMKTLKFANDTNTYKVVDGDALHTLNDMANKSKGSWDGNTLPPDIPNGVTYVECSNNSDTMNFPSNYGICISINSSTYRQT